MIKEEFEEFKREAHQAALDAREEFERLFGVKSQDVV